MRKMLTFAIYAATITVLIPGNSVNAAYVDSNGNACQNAYEVDYQSHAPLSFSTSGVFNASGSDGSSALVAWAACPLSMGTLEDTLLGVSGVWVTYNDTNNSTSSLFYCTVRVKDVSGNTYISAPKYTCSASEGCDVNAEPQYVGRGYLHFTGLPAQLASHPVGTNYFILCNIPPYGSTIQSYFHE